MKKLISIVVMVGLMLWFPLLAEAKDKNENNTKHYNYGKPFATLQELIDVLESTVSSLNDRISILESGGSGGGGFSSIYYPVWNNTISQCKAINFITDPDRPPVLIGYECSAECNPGDQVISGGYRFETSTAADLFSVYGSSPEVFAENQGWSVFVKNDPTTTDALTTQLQVYAVCAGQ